MRTKSAEVLDEADRFEDILNWQLFKIEQDQMLWGARMEAPKDWYPGFPMYKRPFGVTGAILYGRQVVRPMFQLFEGNDQLDTHDSDDFYLSRGCTECEVMWDGPAGCWVCGEGEIEYDEPVGKSIGVFTDFDIDHNQYIVFIDFNNRAFTEAMDAVRNSFISLLEEADTAVGIISRGMVRSFRGLNSRILESLETRSEEDIRVNGIRIPRDLVLDSMREPILPEPPFAPFRPSEHLQFNYVDVYDPNRRRRNGRGRG